VQALGQIGQAHDFGPETVGQQFAPVQAAVGDGHGLGLFGCKVGGHQLDHFTRTDKQHADVLEVFEQLTGQSHRSSGHADRVGTDFGGAAHLFGHGKTALEQLVQGAAQCACLLGSPHGVLELAQNLGFTQHHGVEAAGDAKGVASRFIAFQHVSVGVQFGGAHPAGLGQPAQGVVGGGLVGSAIDFGAVAGRQDGGFGFLRNPMGQIAPQALQSGHQFVHGERKPTAQIQRRSGVVQTQGPDSHEGHYRHGMSTSLDTIRGPGV